jgi:hypothetical protein
MSDRRHRKDHAELGTLLRIPSPSRRILPIHTVPDAGLHARQLIPLDAIGAGHVAVLLIAFGDRVAAILRPFQFMQATLHTERTSGALSAVPQHRRSP